MLSRYTMYRRRPKDAGPLPAGIRHDTRWRTRHVLRPTQAIVEAYLADPTDEAFTKFRAAYLETLRERAEADFTPFRQLAQLAAENDVYLGCSCPTKKNPDVRHCHTWLALEFMAKRFPRLNVVFPKESF